MEVLIFILIMVFVFVSGKKGKKGQDGKARAVSTPRQSAAEVRQKFEALKQEAQAQFEEAKAKKVVPVNLPTQKSPVFMASPHQEASILDEEGCVGGSMEHTHDEGESREEHRRHVEAAKHREAEETRAAQDALELREMNLRKLRQAVVMAEILDRPKALRRS